MERAKCALAWKQINCIIAVDMISREHPRLQMIDDNIFQNSFPLPYCYEESDMVMPAKTPICDARYF
jgi:hypothetical protein